jgi:hypothetical protein
VGEGGFFLAAPDRYDPEGGRRPIETGCSHIFCRACGRGSSVLPSVLSPSPPSLGLWFWLRYK